jgi:hypothetical protein
VASELFGPKRRKDPHALAFDEAGTRKGRLSIVIKTLALGTLVIGLVAAVGVYIYSRATIETPAYVVERQEARFEVRLYPELTLAQLTTEPESRRAAVQSAFNPLARYIFARDRSGDKIAMTAPVVQTPQGGAWVVSFIMPAGMNVQNLPSPSGDVRLVTEPARRMAVLRFSGSWTDARFDAAAERLLDWTDAQGLIVSGPPEFGYYDDPFTPAFLRRNEVMVPVLVSVSDGSSSK